MNDDLLVSTLQSVRVARGFTRAEFLRTLRAVTGQEIKLRNLRAWECRETTLPAWAVDAYRATLNLSDVEVAAVVRWAGTVGTVRGEDKK